MGIAVLYSPYQLIRIKQASTRAFYEINKLYNEHQKKLEKQEKSLLSERKIVDFKHDNSPQKKGTPSYQEYLKTKDDIKRRMVQEFFAIEKFIQEWRNLKKKIKEKDDKHDESLKDIREKGKKKDDRKFETRQDNIKIEKDLKKDGKSIQ